MCQRILQAMTQTLEIPLNVNYIYEYEFTLNQDIQGGKWQSFWRCYWFSCAELGRKVLPHLPVSLPAGNEKVVLSSHRE